MASRAMLRAMMILLGDGDDVFAPAVSAYALLTEDEYAIDTEDGESIEIEQQTPESP